MQIIRPKIIEILKKLENQSLENRLATTDTIEYQLLSYGLPYCPLLYNDDEIYQICHNIIQNEISIDDTYNNIIPTDLRQSLYVIACSSN